MKRSLSTMSISQLNFELANIEELIEHLEETDEIIGSFQLESARALKFAIECQLRNRQSAPTTNKANVVSLSDYRAKREAKRVNSTDPELPRAS